MVWSIGRGQQLGDPSSIYLHRGQIPQHVQAHLEIHSLPSLLNLPSRIGHYVADERSYPRIWTIQGESLGLGSQGMITTVPTSESKICRSRDQTSNFLGRVWRVSANPPALAWMKHTAFWKRTDFISPVSLSRPNCRGEMERRARLTTKVPP